MAAAPYDLICIGGGLAGMTAAVRAAELGLRVAVLEQENDPRYPCNSRFSGGVFHVSYNDVQAAASQLAEAMTQATKGEADPALVATVAGDAGGTLDWLRAHGARFIRGTISWQRWILAPPRPLTPGLVWAGRGPDILLRELARHLEERQGRLVRDMRATALRIEQGRCTGVRAERGGRCEEFKSHAVVIADGGFQADPELFREHIGPRPDLVVQRGAGNARGDGLRMAREAGAALTDMHRFYGHLLSVDALRSDQLWPYPTLDAVSTVSVVVDRSGRRFLDEGLGGIYIANEIAALADPTSAVVVLDSKTWNEVGQGAPYLPNSHIERSGGTVHRAATIPALADAAGIPREALTETIGAFNAAIEQGGFDRLTPARSIRTAPRPIAVAPFLAVPLAAGITNTMGGIAIDGEARVRRPDGTVIDGLYAAGTTTGGLEGGSEVGYVGGLIKAGVLGKRAAEHAARIYVPSRRALN